MRDKFTVSGEVILQMAQLINDEPGITRTEICKTLGCSTTTVVVGCKQLIAIGCICRGLSRSEHYSGEGYTYKVGYFMERDLLTCDPIGTGRRRQ